MYCKYKEECLVFSDHNSMKLESITGRKLEINKYVEIKQQTSEQPIGQRKNQKESKKKYLETNKNVNTT